MQKITQGPGMRRSKWEEKVKKHLCEGAWCKSPTYIHMRCLLRGIMQRAEVGVWKGKRAGNAVNAWENGLREVNSGRDMQETADQIQPTPAQGLLKINPLPSKEHWWYTNKNEGTNHKNSGNYSILLPMWLDLFLRSS